MPILNNFQEIQDAIQQTEIKHHRLLGSVLLLAVTKGQKISTILETYHLGLRNFGENYVQEALKKQLSLPADIIWHFIGPIQSNKCKLIANNFSWVHSIANLKVAELFNKFRLEQLPPLQVCIQVNLTHEETKSGIAPENVAALALQISKLPHLQLRGLMLIPPKMIDVNSQYNLFIELKNMMLKLNKECKLTMDTLSMGMSEDYIPAIAAGSTIIRIGRGLYYT